MIGRDARRVARDEAAARFARGAGNVAETEEARGAQDRIRHAWARSAELADSPAIVALRRRALEGRRPGRVPARARALVGGGVATAIAAAAAWLLVPAVGPLLQSPSATVAARRFATGPGRQTVVELSDGSRVRLDGRSAISVAYAPHRRLVRLEGGRAYFTVRHDARRPFVVEAAGGETVDVGTSFTVARDGERVTVALVEGEVAIRSAGAATPLTLRPGERARYSGAAPTRLVRAAGDPLDWTRGIVALDDVPLPEAVRLLSRYTARPITLANDPALADKSVTAVFRTSGGDGFAGTLASALSLRVVRGPAGETRLERP